MRTSHKLLKWILGLIILAVVIVLAVLFFGGQKGNQYTEEIARTQDIVTYYTFSGNLEPGDAQVVYATGRGTVKELLKQEGDLVEDEEAVLQPKSGSKIESTMDGTISDIYVKADDAYTAGDELFRVADYAHPVLKIKVDEYDISALSKGMEVSITVQATGAQLQGEITRIAQEATVENDVAYYVVEIAVPQDGSLVMGLTCEVSVLRESALNATTVSMDAIQYDEDNKPYVYCYSRGDEIVRQSVLLGINNGTIVEIKDGVKSGEAILIPKTLTYPMMNMGTELR